MEKSKWKEIKDAFIKNPNEAKDLFALSRTIEERQNGCTLYDGNCILKKECIEKLCEFLKLGKPTFKPTAKKHIVSFSINDSSTFVFNGQHAIIHCPEEMVDKYQNMAEYIYPSECIFVNEED